VIQALWPLDTWGEQPAGWALSICPCLWTAAQTSSAPASIPGVLPRTAFDTAQTLASVNHFTDGCPF
jgi:hypothetical protein